jgi:signal transduction histidine kinase
VARSAGTLTLSVADNGIGIPADYRERAFQLFGRVPNGAQYKGTGIGLAICKKIVESLHGSISIADNPTGGSIFHISLPAKVLVQ